MITSKEDLHYYIKEDIKRNLQEKKISWLKYLLKKYLGSEDVAACRYLKCLRHYEYAINCMNGFMGKMARVYYRQKLMRLSYKYNLQISPNSVGYGLWLLHFRVGGGIILNVASMGNYCSANAGVVVGNKDGQENRAIVGDNVTFTIGAKVIGKVNIGDNVLVAPNSVVIKDVPSNCVVSGVPAKIIIKDGKKIL